MEKKIEDQNNKKAGFFNLNVLGVCSLCFALGFITGFIIYPSYARNGADILLRGSIFGIGWMLVSFPFGFIRDKKGNFSHAKIAAVGIGLFVLQIFSKSMQ